jgi:hypothetical protein
MTDATPPAEPSPVTPHADGSADQTTTPIPAGTPQPPQASGLAPDSPAAIAILYRSLHDTCGGILQASLQAEPAQLVAESHVFLYELEHWVKVIAPNKEQQLLAVAAREYQYALLALAQGLYRQAFKGLRGKSFSGSSRRSLGLQGGQAGGGKIRVSPCRKPR